MTFVCDRHKQASPQCDDTCTLTVPSAPITDTGRAYSHAVTTLDCGCVYGDNDECLALCDTDHTRLTLYGWILRQGKQVIHAQAAEASAQRRSMWSESPLARAPHTRTDSDLWTLGKSVLAAGADSVRDYLADCVKLPVTCKHGWCAHLNH